METVSAVRVCTGRNGRCSAKRRDTGGLAKVGPDCPASQVGVPVRRLDLHRGPGPGAGPGGLAVAFPTQEPHAGRLRRGEGLAGRPAAPPVPGTRDCLPSRPRRSSRTAWLHSRPGFAVFTVDSANRKPAKRAGGTGTVSISLILA